jgi:type I restriction enzyme S subunit
MVEFANSRATGANLPRLSPKALADFEIPLPPLDEQKRIAAILDQADELRRKRQRAIDRLNQLGQAIFYEMFGDPQVEEKNYIELSSLLTFVTSGGRGWSKYYAEEGSLFIRSLDVQMNYLSLDDAAYIAAPNNAEARRTLVLPGDVLLTITGSKIGRVAPAPENLATAFVSQHVAILRMDRSKLDPVFLSYFLSLEGGGQKQIAQNQYGQTKPGLNFDQIGRFRLPNIPLNEQKEFAKRIAAVRELHAQAARTADAHERLFGSIQDRAFRGEL